MAQYLEAYAEHFRLPVRTGARVDRLWRFGERYRLQCGENTIEADHVVVAMASYQEPRLPAFAGDLHRDIVQLHSSAYRNPAQLREGPLLIAGAGNSGAEIALELAPRRETWLSGRDTGHVPFRVEGWAGRLLLVRLVLRVVFHRVLTVATPLGRKLRPALLHVGGPLIRVKPRAFRTLHVQRVPRTVGSVDGAPQLADGRILQVANVVWCTGYHPGFFVD